MRPMPDKHTAAVFAYRLKMCMRSKKLNTHKLSIMADVNYGTLKTLMSGHSLPNANTVVKICRSLGVSADWLLGIKH